MGLNYKKLGGYIRTVDERNSDLAITNLQGVSITKEFIPSIANIIGTDLSTYKIVRTGQFAYGPVTSRNGDKVSIALLKGDDCIISSSYVPFEVYKPDELFPEYLMLWFMRPEFDRYARFMSNGSAREVFDWDCMCGVELPVPSIDEQRKIVHDYQVITDRIALLQKMNENLEEQEDTLFQVFCSNDSWVEGRFSDITVSSIAGDWGSDTKNGNENAQVTCVRGADIPGLTVGITNDAPTRYILQKNYLAKSLPTNSMIIEISGGSPVQSTGRIALLTDVLRNKLEKRVICSNFCKAITVNEDYLYFFYLSWRHLYKINRLFDYENSTIGLKNFDYQSFVTQEPIRIPSVKDGKYLNALIEPIRKTIIYNGLEIEKLIHLREVILPNIMK